MKSEAAPIHIVAEAGVNHNGEVETALRLVEAAAQAGADAVKFQTFRTDLLASVEAPLAHYQQAASGAGRSQAALLRPLELREPDLERLAAACADLGIAFLASAFDTPSLRFLVHELGVSTIKIASGDLTNAPLLFEAARSNCNIILSTGMSTMAEIADAIAVLALGFTRPDERPTPELLEPPIAAAAAAVVQERLTLLQCTSQYPAPVAEANLRAMDTLRDTFGCAVGFSDHTPGIAVAIAAAARGAVLIEKHLTLDRALAGPDHRASLEPADFGRLVAGVRSVEAALGSAEKSVQPSELDTRTAARRSLAAVRPVQAGEAFTEGNLGALRPGTGIAPARYWELLGRKASRSYGAGELLSE